MFLSAHNEIIKQPRQSLAQNKFPNEKTKLSIAHFEQVLSHRSLNEWTSNEFLPWVSISVIRGTAMTIISLQSSGCLHTAWSEKVHRDITLPCWEGSSRRGIKIACYNPEGRKLNGWVICLHLRPSREIFNAVWLAGHIFLVKVTRLKELEWLSPGHPACNAQAQD